MTTLTQKNAGSARKERTQRPEQCAQRPKRRRAGSAEREQTAHRMTNGAGTDTMSPSANRTSADAIRRCWTTKGKGRHHADQSHRTQDVHHTRRAAARAGTAGAVGTSAAHSGSHAHHGLRQIDHLRKDQRWDFPEAHQDFSARGRMAPFGNRGMDCRCGHQRPASLTVRLSFKCPHCGTRSTVKKMRVISRITSELGYQCLNDECRFSFVVVSEIVRALSVPSKPNPEISIPLSTNIHRKAIIDQLRTAREADEPDTRSEWQTRN